MDKVMAVDLASMFVFKRHEEKKEEQPKEKPVKEDTGEELVAEEKEDSKMNVVSEP